MTILDGYFNNLSGATNGDDKGHDFEATTGFDFKTAMMMLSGEGGSLGRGTLFVAENEAKETDERESKIGHRYLLYMAAPKPIEVRFGEIFDRLNSMMATEKEAQVTLQDLMKLKLDNCAAAANEIQFMKDYYQSNGIKILTLEDVFQPGSPEWATYNLAENRVVMGDKTNGFYVLDENGNRFDLPPVYNRIIDQIMKKDPSLLSGTDINTADAERLNNAFIAERQNLDDYEDLYFEQEEHAGHETKQEELNRRLKELRDSDIPEPVKTKLIEEAEQAIKAFEREHQRSERRSRFLSPESNGNQNPIPPEARREMRAIRASNLTQDEKNAMISEIRDRFGDNRWTDSDRMILKAIRDSNLPHEKKREMLSNLREEIQTRTPSASPAHADTTVSAENTNTTGTSPASEAKPEAKPASQPTELYLTLHSNGSASLTPPGGR